MNDVTENQRIQRFWSDVYDAAYGEVDQTWTKKSLLSALEQLEDMFRIREQLPVMEVPLGRLSGRKILEIGSGAGGHSALFAKYGAVVTSVDITLSRVRATQDKFNLLDASERGCQALQADSERLPFADNSFDCVYSNGVLHHAGDTDKALDEVYRVLRPGGRTAIMLYCKSSWHYWFNMLFCVGFLQLKMFRSRNWLGHATEWVNHDKQPSVNPFTRCYTAAELRSMFKKYDSLSLRKTEFYFYLIPKLGRLYRRYQIKKYGEHPGGILVYGKPWPRQSPLEMKLGKIMGWAWNIGATKPE